MAGEASAAEAPLLRLRGLKTHFFTDSGVVRAVDGVDLEVRPGEVLGVVGESGCGKTMMALSILRLVDAPGRHVAGEILFEGQDLARLDARRMTALRGEAIAMIFQQPGTSLNPVVRIGRQIGEQLVRRRGLDRREAWKRAVELLQEVGIPAAAEKARAYPHELSGGQAQRVMIAMALALEPRLLIADEPTTVLDVTVQAQILELLRERCRARRTAMIFVTHDLGVIAQIADRVVVMYAGQVVEAAPVTRLFEAPAHPYTRGLLRSTPALGRRRSRLEEIPGTVPNLAVRPRGCRFAPRCADRVERNLERCDREEPPLFAATAGQQSRCWLSEEGAAHSAAEPRS